MEASAICSREAAAAIALVQCGRARAAAACGIARSIAATANCGGAVAAVRRADDDNETATTSQSEQASERTNVRERKQRQRARILRLRDLRQQRRVARTRTSRGALVGASARPGRTMQHRAWGVGARRCTAAVQWCVVQSTTRAGLLGPTRETIWRAPPSGGWGKAAAWDHLARMAAAAAAVDGRRRAASNGRSRHRHCSRRTVCGCVRVSSSRRDSDTHERHLPCTGRAMSSSPPPPTSKQAGGGAVAVAKIARSCRCFCVCLCLPASLSLYLSRCLARRRTSRARFSAVNTRRHRCCTQGKQCIVG